MLASSPITATQQWVMDNDPLYNSNISSFASADVTHADSAFEFVFSNMAMNKFLPNAAEKRKKQEQLETSTDTNECSVHCSATR